MFRVTFYSYKGGVGRTRAMLQVARILAELGRKVVAVELDLEAPEFGRTRATGTPPAQAAPRPGVSDLILGWREGGTPSLTDALYQVPGPRLGGRLQLLGAGTRGLELANAIPALYADLQSDHAQLFQLLLAEIEAASAPDYLLFDSSTGLTGISGVSTLELPELLVVLTNLSEPSVNGTERVLRELDAHDAWDPRAPTLLVLSPVPRKEDFTLAFAPTTDAPSLLGPAPPHPLTLRLQGVVAQLKPLVTRHLEAVAERFPRLDPDDLMPQLEYDPWLPLTGEFEPPRSATLRTQYEELARLVTLAHPDETAPRARPSHTPTPPHHG